MSGKPYTPTEFDIKLGNLILITRNRLGISQKELAVKLGVSFQQVHKYETGGNRIYASRLKMIADAFEMPVSALIDETDKPYLHDEQILFVIDKMYHASPKSRDLIVQAINAIANGVK